MNLNTLLVFGCLLLMCWVSFEAGGYFTRIKVRKEFDRLATYISKFAETLKKKEDEKNEINKDGQDC